MATGLEEGTRARTDQKEAVARNDVSVKLDAQVAKEAKLVATNRGITLAQYISEILAPIVHQHLLEEVGGLFKSPKPPRKSEK
jgi:hypothetical protein